MKKCFYPQQILSFYKDRQVLVTGGAGFIGSHLVEQLVLFGAHVTVLDDLSYGSLSNLESIRNDIHFLHDTITDKSVCLMATQKKDIIFHCAALTSVVDSENDHSKYHDVNIRGTEYVLDAAVQNNVNACIFSSSAAVYGNQPAICSEDSPVKPCSFYGLTKLVGEIFMRFYTHNHAMQMVILRYFNVYGQRQRSDTGVIARFSELMEHNKPITIYGDGLQTRDFVPVDHIIFANLMAGMRAESLSGQAINIATGKSKSLIDIITELKKKYPDYTGTMLFAPRRTSEIIHCSADCRKFFKELC